MKLDVMPTDKKVHGFSNRLVRARVTLRRYNLRPQSCVACKNQQLVSHAPNYIAKEIGQFLDSGVFVNALPRHLAGRNQPGYDSIHSEDTSRSPRTRLQTKTNNQPKASKQSAQVIVLVQIFLLYCFVDRAACEIGD
jgi:hypothetical protein